MFGSSGNCRFFLNPSSFTPNVLLLDTLQRKGTFQSLNSVWRTTCRTGGLSQISWGEDSKLWRHLKKDHQTVFSLFILLFFFLFPRDGTCTRVKKENGRVDGDTDGDERPARLSTSCSSSNQLRNTLKPRASNTKKKKTQVTNKRACMQQGCNWHEMDFFFNSHLWFYST